MKSLKIMSIVGLVIAGVSILCLYAWNNILDYESAIGWGIIASMYLVALSIVSLSKSKQVNK